jgi:hypothetical protein
MATCFTVLVGRSLLWDVMVFVAAATGHASVQLGLMLDTASTRTARLNGLSRTHSLKGDIFGRDGCCFPLDSLHHRRVVLASRWKILKLVELGSELLTGSQVSGVCDKDEERN